MIFFSTLVFPAIFADVLLALSAEEGMNHADALESDTVLFACHLDDDVDGTVVWHYGTESKTLLSVGREMAWSLDTDRKSRYSIEGSPISEHFDLRIRNVKERDAGSYSCSYQTRTSALIYVSSGILTVHLLPQIKSPVCNIAYVKARNTNSSRYVDLLCTWHGSNSNDFRGTWYRDGIPISSQVSSASSLSHQRLLSEKDRNVNFTCVITSPYSTTWSRSCTVVPLRDTGLKVRLEPPVLKGQVGDSVSIECRSEGADSFSWSLDANSTARFLSSNRFEVSKGNRFLTLKDIRAADNGTKIACVVNSLTGIRAAATSFLFVSTLTNESITSLSPVTIAFAMAPPSTALPLHVVIGMSVFLATILLLLVALVIRKTYGNRRKVSRVSDTQLSRQREVLRGSVRVDSEVLYQSISGEPRDGTENVNQEWTINVDNHGSVPMGESVTDMSDHCEANSRNEGVKKSPLYAKPNKRRKKQSQRQIILSVNSDVINFYENVSKHSSLTSQISRYSAQCLESDNIYESVPRNYSLSVSKECLSEASDLYASIGDEKMDNDIIHPDRRYSSPDAGESCWEYSRNNSLVYGDIDPRNIENNVFETCIENHENVQV